MRIITGKFKGRTLKVLGSKFVRPTTDRNKEAIFAYLNNYIDFDEIKICDIYAGSGALGLEALSRGASSVDFVEKNYSVYKILQENINTLEVNKYVRIFKTTAVKFSKMQLHAEYDLILADPPFFKDDIYLVLENLIKNHYLKENGLILIERSIQTKKDDIKHFKVEPIKRMGDSLIYLISE